MGNVASQAPDGDGSKHKSLGKRASADRRFSAIAGGRAAADPADQAGAMATAAIAEWVRKKMQASEDAGSPPQYDELRTLNFSRYGWGSKEVEALAQALAFAPGLVELSLGFNAVGDAGIQALVEAARRGALQKLERLYLAGNQIGSDGCDSLASALKAGSLPACTYINLAKNPETEERRWLVEEALKPEAERYH